MDTGLLLAIVGLGVAGLASMLGIWMERDPHRPPRWAIGLTILIGSATVVSVFQSVADARASAKTEEDLARMLQTLDKIATDSGQDFPELDNFLSKEMETQSRSNPDVLKKMAARVSAEGGDPSQVLGKHLPAAELGGIKGVKATAVAAAANPEETKKLKSELASVRKQLADAEAARKQNETAAKKAESAQKEKAEAEAKVNELREELERLQKKNQRLKQGSSSGSRWDKG